MTTPRDPLVVIAEQAAVLKAVEWTPYTLGGPRYCPLCGNGQNHGHGRDCRLSAALSASAPMPTPERVVVEYTPGPWSTCEPENRGTVYAKCVPIATAHDGRGYDWLPGRNFLGKDVAEANARLIVAAVNAVLAAGLSPATLAADPECIKRVVEALQRVRDQPMAHKPGEYSVGWNDCAANQSSMARVALRAIGKGEA